MSPHVRSLIKSLGHELGIGLAPDTHGIVALRYGEARSCVIAIDGDDHIRMLAPLTTVHDRSRRVLFITALRLNSSAGETGDGVIGYSERRCQLEYSIGIATQDLHADRLLQALHRFLDTSITLSSALENAVRDGIAQ